MHQQAAVSSAPGTWRQFVTLTYPDVLTATYCVPPLHFNRVPYQRVLVPGIPADLPALVKQTPAKTTTGHSASPSGQPPAPIPPTNQPASSSAQAQTHQILSRRSASKTSHPQAQWVPSQPASNSAPQQTGTTTLLPVHSVTAVAAQTVSSLPLGPKSYNAQQAQLPSSNYSLWTTEPHTGAATNTPATVFHSDTSDDFCQQYLLYNLHALAKHVAQVMFVLSSVNFQNYLNSGTASSSSSSSSPSSSKSFPRPRDLQKDNRGDFDFLVVHRHRGLLVAELKSVGMQRVHLQLSQVQDDVNVSKRLDRAVRQLEKGRRVASHLVSDVEPGLPVRTALFLPFVSRCQLLRVLTAGAPLAQKVCSCLCVSTIQEAADMTLCSDDLSDPADPWNVTAHVLSRLTSWWQRRMTSHAGPVLTDDQYLEIIGRFVGPATTVSVHCAATPRLTVEVRTQGEAVAELGSRLARLVLTPEQTDLLTRAPPLVFLTGPPGTGKTVMLVLMGLVWCHRGWNVQVVSVSDDSRAASLLVCHQIRKTLGTTAASGAGVSAGHVLFRSYQFCKAGHSEETSVETAVEELIRASPKHPVAKDLVDRLLQADPNLHLWAANIDKTVSVAKLQTEMMTRPLRSAPCVVREIQRAVESRHYYKQVVPYSTDAVPSPADGFSPTVMWHQGTNHTDHHYPFSCQQCGVQVAAALRHLGVGDPARRVPNSPSPLQFRDVLILRMRSFTEEEEEIYDPTGTLVSPVSPFVRGLRAEGIPVCVVEMLHRVESIVDEERWKKHHSGGCSVAVEPVEDFGLGDLFGVEPGEEKFEGKSDKEKEQWRLHYEQGCEVESKEEGQRWEKQRQERRNEWKTKLEDMATSRLDHVIVTSDEFVQGLERKVVVVLMAGITEMKHMDRMKSISRCTTHLIIVQSEED
ncbi:uncharacterized protein LOC143293786 isoform X2 [Babylonia areolata]|uniref:uncharacterized protein LOC143293786 isoform X2 n=1 Tax=Babylonia areolata TaxID=304850 RepID=UPI003FD13CD4